MVWGWSGVLRDAGLDSEARHRHHSRDPPRHDRVRGSRALRRLV